MKKLTKKNEEYWENKKNKENENYGRVFFNMYIINYITTKYKAKLPNLQTKFSRTQVAIFRMFFYFSNDVLNEFNDKFKL